MKTYFVALAGALALAACNVDTGTDKLQDAGGGGQSTGGAGGAPTGGTGGQVTPDVGTGGQVVTPDVGTGGAATPDVAVGGQVVPPDVGPGGQVVPPDVGSGGQVVPPDVGPGGQVVPPDVGAGGQVVMPDAGPTPDALVPADAVVVPVDGAVIPCGLPGEILADGLSCCAGLQQACGNSLLNDPCDAPCEVQTCILPGDGECSYGEDLCNSPDDCAVPDDCVPAGGLLVMAPDMPPCCANLMPVMNSEPGEDGICQPVVGTSVCVLANDHVCGLGESYCNSFADCPRPELPCSENGHAVDPGLGGDCCDPLAVPIMASAMDENGACLFAGGMVCAANFDGLCGEGESYCNSPQDCPAPPPPCTPANLALDPSQPLAVCCEGLVPTGCDIPDGDGVCRDTCAGVNFCTPCGNGVCDGGAENACNCPQDCAAVPGCTAEGASHAVLPEAFCCPGTGAISCAHPDVNDVCPNPGQPCLGSVFCAQCGDGECGPGENKCNCNNDCD